MIPTYNQASYIEQAVVSALSQDYPNLEVIVSDDSANEETKLLLTPYLTDNRFSYYKNSKQLGRVANYRKLLFEYAKGEWVIMLDGDDYYIDSTYISRAVGFVMKFPSLVLVGAGNKVFNESNNVFSDSPLVAKDVVFDGKNVLRDGMSLPSHHTDLYLRSLACKLDFYRDPSMASDSESLFRLCLHGDVAYLSDIVSVWRVHGQNTTYTLAINKQIREIVFIEKIYQEALRKIDKTDADKWRTNMYRMMVTHLLKLSFSSNDHLATLKILFLLGKHLGFKVCVSYLKSLARQYVGLSDISSTRRNILQ